jgi:hypothetical protein
MPKTSDSGRRRDGVIYSAPPIIAAMLLIGSAAQARADDQADPSTVAPPPAAARPATVPPPTHSKKIQILVTPYLWLPWVSTGVHPVNPALPSASKTISPDQLVKHLTWVPFMGAAEVRGSSWGLAVDYLHAPLTSSVSTRTILFGNGGADVTMDIGSAKVFYRPIAGPDQYLDIGAGVRAWGLGGGVSLARGLLPPVSVSGGQSWADPLIAARYHHELGGGFGLTADGDVGGFGVGAQSDWQLIGTIDYKPRSWPTLHLGFRTLNFNYHGELARFTASENGPYLAATFQF